MTTQPNNLSTADAPLRLTQFKQDDPRDIAHSTPVSDVVTIEGVKVDRLAGNADGRGQLFELMTVRDGPIDPIVHVYQVIAEPGSIRGWVYHTLQTDRLHFTLGDFEVQLLDIREDSPTFKAHMKLRVGANHPCRVFIPPWVAHLVRNVSHEAAAFINFPTRYYDPKNPDKFRFQGSYEQLLDA